MLAAPAGNKRVHRSPDDRKVWYDLMYYSTDPRAQMYIIVGMSAHVEKVWWSWPVGGSVDLGQQITR